MWKIRLREFKSLEQVLSDDNFGSLYPGGDGNLKHPAVSHTLGSLQSLCPSKIMGLSLVSSSLGCHAWGGFSTYLTKESLVYRFLSMTLPYKIFWTMQHFKRLFLTERMTYICWCSYSEGSLETRVLGLAFTQPAWVFLWSWPWWTWSLASGTVLCPSIASLQQAGMCPN